MLIKRHKVTKEDGSFFTPNDFSVGECVTIYGRTYFLTDADQFTRAFFNEKLGRDFGGPLPYPDDPVDQYRATFGLTRGRGKQSPINHALFKSPPATLTPTLLHHRKVADLALAILQ